MDRQLSEFTPEQRSRDPYHHIDPGFINVRLAYSTFGSRFVELFERERSTGTDHWARLRNDHLLVDFALAACKARQVKTLAEALEEPGVGDTFSSTETLEGAADIYTAERVRNRVLLPFEYDREVYLEFGVEHFVASTGKTEQANRASVTVIGVVREASEQEVRLAPIIMGAPSYDHPLNHDIGFDLMWEGWSWYETYPGDIDEFSWVISAESVREEEWMPVMRGLPEADVKRRLLAILDAGPGTADWGGEHADIAATVHLQGRRLRASFLLKGPSA